MGRGSAKYTLGMIVVEVIALVFLTAIITPSVWAPSCGTQAGSGACLAGATPCGGTNPQPLSCSDITCSNGETCGVGAMFGGRCCLDIPVDPFGVCTGVAGCSCISRVRCAGNYCCSKSIDICDGVSSSCCTPNPNACTGKCGTVANGNCQTQIYCGGCSGTDTCGGGGTPNVCGTPACTVSSWSPDPSTVCSGTSFTQTSNCGTTRNNIPGTKTDGACCSPTVFTCTYKCAGQFCDNGCGAYTVPGTKQPDTSKASST